MTLVHHRLLGALALVTVAGTLACGGSDTTSPMSAERIALVQAESRWNAAAVQNYDYDLVTSFAAAHDSAQVQVRSGQVTLSKSYLSGQNTNTGTTIPDFFDSVDAAIVGGLKVNVTYDPQLGYPATGSISAQISTPAGPSSWQIVHFTRVP